MGFVGGGKAGEVGGLADGGKGKGYELPLVVFQPAQGRVFQGTIESVRDLERKSSARHVQGLDGHAVHLHGIPDSERSAIVHEKPPGQAFREFDHQGLFVPPADDKPLVTAREHKNPDRNGQSHACPGHAELVSCECAGGIHQHNRLRRQRLRIRHLREYSRNTLFDLEELPDFFLYEDR